jgi:putative phosphoesterase
MLVGVISDTHSYLDPQVLELLPGVDHILHAGDVGDARIVAELESIAPVTVVRGNNDREGPASLFPLKATEVLEGRRVMLTHEMKVPKRPDSLLVKGYLEAGIDIVVFGHSHIAFQEYRGDLLFFNPGAAGKRRFKVVPSIGFLRLGEGKTEATIVPLGDEAVYKS